MVLVEQPAVLLAEVRALVVEQPAVLLAEVQALVVELKLALREALGTSPPQPLNQSTLRLAEMTASSNFPRQRCNRC